MEEEPEAQQEFICCLPEVQLELNTNLPNSKPLPSTPILFCHLIGAKSSISRTVSGQIRMLTICILGWFCHRAGQVTCGNLFLYVLKVLADYKTFNVLSFYLCKYSLTLCGQ